MLWLGSKTTVLVGVDLSLAVSPDYLLTCDGSRSTHEAYRKMAETYGYWFLEAVDFEYLKGEYIYYWKVSPSTIR